MSITKATFSLIKGAVFNVLDYGADPTGTDDSTQAIQNCINETARTGLTTIGGTVYFPTGIYKITDELDLTLCDGLTLLGDNPDSSVIVQYTATKSAFINTTSTINYLNVENLGVTVSTGVTHTSGYGFLLFGNGIENRYVRFSNAKINGFENGIKLGESWHTLLSHVQVFGASGHTTGTGIQIGSGTVASLVGTGSTGYTLPASPDVTKYMSVTVDGADSYETSGWTLSGNSLTFVTAPAVGADIRVVYDGQNTTTCVLESVYVVRYHTCIRNVTCDGLELQNTIVEQATLGLSTERWAYGTLYAETIATHPILAYSPVSIKPVNNVGIWGSSNNYANLLTEYNSKVPRPNIAQIIKLGLTSNRPITESTSATGIITWTNPEYNVSSGTTLPLSTSQQNLLALQNGFYRLNGVFHFDALNTGENIRVQLVYRNTGGIAVWTEDLWLEASGNLTYPSMIIDTFRYLPAGYYAQVYIGSSVSTRSLLGGTTGGEASWLIWQAVTSAA